MDHVSNMRANNCVRNDFREVKKRSKKKDWVNKCVRVCASEWVGKKETDHIKLIHEKIVKSNRLHSMEPRYHFKINPFTHTQTHTLFLSFTFTDSGQIESVLVTSTAFDVHTLRPTHFTYIKVASNRVALKRKTHTCMHTDLVYNWKRFSYHYYSKINMYRKNRSVVTIRCSKFLIDRQSRTILI